MGVTYANNKYIDTTINKLRNYEAITETSPLALAIWPDGRVGLIDHELEKEIGEKWPLMFSHKDLTPVEDPKLIVIPGKKLALLDYVLTPNSYSFILPAGANVYTGKERPLHIVTQNSIAFGESFSPHEGHHSDSHEVVFAVQFYKLDDPRVDELGKAKRRLLINKLDALVAQCVE